MLDDVVLNRDVVLRSRGPQAIADVRIVATLERATRDQRIVAVNREAVDGDVVRGDGEERRLISVGDDDGFRAAYRAAGDSGVRALDLDGLVDGRILFIGAVINHHRAA